MSKNLLFGVVLPIIFLASGVGFFVLLERPQTPSIAPLGDNIPALLNVLPIAEVQSVRTLSELSETLNIPVSGTVVPYRELQLAAEVQGRIIEKDPTVRSGNHVSQGQVLYRIDPRDYELDIERLTRRRDQELASLAELQQEIENSQSLLEVVDQQLSLADIDVKRFESLGGNFASAAELDEARRNRLSAMNQKVTVRNQLLSSQTRSARLELAIKSAETELEQAALDLKRTVVTSPVDGRIVSEQVEVDSYVQRGSQMIVVEDTQKVEVACNIRMDQLFWILDEPKSSTEQIVSPAQVTRYELPTTPVRVRFRTSGRNESVYEWRGRLDRYDGAGLDAQSRTVPIRVVVDRPSDVTVIGDAGAEPASGGGPPMLVRGMFVEVIIEARPATQLLLVPKLSIKPATMSYQIWKFKPDDAAVFASRQAIRERALTSEQAESGEPRPAPRQAKKVQVENTLELPKPADWQAGFLQVVDEVRVVGAFVTPTGETEIDGIEYSVCEVDDDLESRDLVIVTPLPGIEGSGRDPVRVRRESVPDPTAAL